MLFNDNLIKPLGLVFFILKNILGQEFIPPSNQSGKFNTYDGYDFHVLELSSPILSYKYPSILAESKGQHFSYFLNLDPWSIFDKPVPQFMHISSKTLHGVYLGYSKYSLLDGYLNDRIGVLPPAYFRTIHNIGIAYKKEFSVLLNEFAIGINNKIMEMSLFDLDFSYTYGLDIGGHITINRKESGDGLLVGASFRNLKSPKIVLISSEQDSYKPYQGFDMFSEWIGFYSFLNISGVLTLLQINPNDKTTEFKGFNMNNSHFKISITPWSFMRDYFSLQNGEAVYSGLDFLIPLSSISTKLEHLIVTVEALVLNSNSDLKSNVNWKMDITSNLF